jgi:hypothetical protein
MLLVVTSLVTALTASAVAAPSHPSAAALRAGIDGFEAEHLSVLEPVANRRHWNAPVLGPDATGHLFAWRMSAAAARNVSQTSAVLTLTAVDRPETQPIVCHPAVLTDLRVICGGSAEPASRYSAKLEVVMRLSTAEGPLETMTTAQGWFVQGLGGTPGSWGGAEWIGVSTTNDTASQFRGVTDIRSGFKSPKDVARATLFVAGLGGFRASINGRPLDPTAVRASVTEWNNRTFYWADDVTADIAAAVSAGGKLVIAVELFKHWYGLANNFYKVAYGPRSLKAVLVLTDKNGKDTFVLPTAGGPDTSTSTGPASSTLDNPDIDVGSGWRHGSGSAIFDDLHGGQIIDGRQASPGWESSGYAASAPSWMVPRAVLGPPGQMMPHPMPRARVLELVRPIGVRFVEAPCGNSSGPGSTYFFELPYEVGGFCTLLLPRGSPAGTHVLVRHGSTASNTCLKEVCGVPGVKEHTTYTCRGDASGMSAHEINWRRLAISGNSSRARIHSGTGDGVNSVPASKAKSGHMMMDDPELEAFTPAFQYSSFKFISVTYDVPAGSKLLPPDPSSLACYRVGVGFDWIGDVRVAGPPTPAPALNTVGPSAKEARCGRVEENDDLTVGCDGDQKIDRIVFASFGVTAGNCTSGFREGLCPTTGKISSANQSFVVVKKACIGKTSCVVPATVVNFAGGGGGGGHTGQTCRHVKKSLAVEVHCSGDPPGASCARSCYDDSANPRPHPHPPAPGPGPGPVATTAAERFNAVVAAGRSSAIANYVFDVPTDAPQGEKRGWLGDSLAVHRLLAAFFDMRAAWIKWSEDMVLTSSMLKPTGTITNKAPCIFGPFCAGDPRHRNQPVKSTLTGVMWGSNMPQLSAFTAQLTADYRFAGRVATAAGQYVGLLQSYTNTDAYEYPELLNVTADADGINQGKKGWPASAYGDWCPKHWLNASSRGCFSMSALLNSVYFILDADAALSLLQTRRHAGTGAGTSGPSEAQIMGWVTTARESFVKAFLHNITARPPAQANMRPFSGLAFRDLYPPVNATHHKNFNNMPSAQVEAASGMAAMDHVLTTSGTQRYPRQNLPGAGEGLRPALASMLAALVTNISSSQAATIDGGIVDLAHLARSLLRYGKPQAAFDLLSADGQNSYYSWAAVSGTLADTSHVMRGGSIGEALFGIGGIQPGFDRGSGSESPSGSNRLGLAPVPWLSGAPRGAAVWRTLAGVATASWAASNVQYTSRWQLWVNVSIPASGGGADVTIMLPVSAQPTSVCVWECGLAGSATSTPSSADAFESQWVSFDNVGGYHKFRAVVPSAVGAPNINACARVWQQGVASKPTALGVEHASWAPSRPGRVAFPALAVGATSGSYAFFAQSC